MLRNVYLNAAATVGRATPTLCAHMNALSAQHSSLCIHRDVLDVLLVIQVANRHWDRGRSSGFRYQGVHAACQWTSVTRACKLKNRVACGRLLG